MGELKELKNIIYDMFNAYHIDKSDADWIICDVLNISRGELNKDLELSTQDIKKVFKLAKKRVRGIPLTQVLGKTNFYGLDFIVTKNVLSPRFETELLVEETAKHTEGLSRGLDMCAGSGAVAITLAKLYNKNMTAVDKSFKALKVLKQNAKIHNVNLEVVKSDLFKKVRPIKFDFIVSNPPYIKSDDIMFLDKEVKNHEPKMALDGGESGLVFYEKIINEAPKFLKRDGLILFEVGKGEAQDVKELLMQDFKEIKIIKDYNKIERIVIGKYNKEGE